MQRSIDKVTGGKSRHLAAGSNTGSNYKGKFTFMPLKKQLGREPSPTIWGAITKQGNLYLGDASLKMLGIQKDGVVLQVFADYDKRAIAFKIITSIKMGDESTITDSSYRFLKPTIQNSSVSEHALLNISFKKVLEQMGWKKNAPVQRVEIESYKDTWSGKVNFFKVPLYTGTLAGSPEPEIICPDGCGRSFNGSIGLGVHRSKEHGYVRPVIVKENN